MHGQSQLAVNFACPGIQPELLEAAAGLSKPLVQCRRRVRIAQRFQKLLDLVRPAPRQPHEALCATHVQTRGLEILQNETFELPAILRPLGIDFTDAAIQRDARLAKARRSQSHMNRQA